MNITIYDVSYSQYIDDETPVSIFVAERCVGEATWGEVYQTLINSGYTFIYGFILEYVNKNGEYVRRLRTKINDNCKYIKNSPKGYTFVGVYPSDKAPKREKVVYWDD